jgi:hypothetical protein
MSSLRYSLACLANEDPFDLLKRTLEALFLESLHGHENQDAIACVVNAIQKYREASDDEDDHGRPLNGASWTHTGEDAERYYHEAYMNAAKRNDIYASEEDGVMCDYLPIDCFWHRKELAELALLDLGHGVSVRRELTRLAKEHADSQASK